MIERRGERERKEGKEKTRDTFEETTDDSQM